ncbi:MAG: FAD binding domain-containing protein [Proteobacteria bacterium]|nr:FAD binding domain-containing protein [Pseudomonadota bacterium]
MDAVLEIKQEFGSQCVLLAGGTDVLPLLKRRNISPGHVVSLRRIPQLRQVQYSDEDGLRVGACVSLRDLNEHQTITKSYPLLAEAALSVAYNQIRNMGTVVGNVCLDNKCSFFNQTAFWWKSRQDCFKRGGERCYVVSGGKQCYALCAGDTVSALIAMDALLEVVGPEGKRQVPVRDFYTGDGRRPHHLRDEEVVTAVRIPPPAPGWKEGFQKKSARGAVDFAIATLSLRLRQNGRAIEDARIVLNGVSTKPIRAEKAEKHLIGKDPKAETIEKCLRFILEEATPLSLVGASAFLRRRMIGTMFRDLVESLVN